MSADVLMDHAPDERQQKKERTAALAISVAVVGAIVASYAPNIQNLIQVWSSDPNYSHGFLVAPIALAILWQRRDELSLSRLRPAWWGWLIVVATLAVRAFLFERNELWLENTTLLPVLAGLTLAFGGWPLLRWALPGIGFLVFLLPIPPAINLIMAGPLQTLATIGSTRLLQSVMGLPVLAEGHVIYIGAAKLEVAQACNGLSMLLSFITLIAATTLLLARSRPLWERVILLLSTVPIALISNILRIAATALAYHLLGVERGEALAHDLAGWAMMPVGLVLILLELKLLSWIIIEEDETEPAPMIIPTSYGKSPAPPKKPI